MVIADAEVSRHHCVIQFENGKWNVSNRSRNGTTVNNKPVQKKDHPLKNGDVIGLNGKFKFKFELPEKPPSHVELEDDDLTCSVCMELFLEPVTLKCAHTFCKFCIDRWKKNNSLCPICRVKIEGEYGTLIIEGLVEKYLSKASDEEKEHRKELTENRKKEMMPDVIEVASSDDSSDEEENMMVAMRDAFPEVFEDHGGYPCLFGRQTH